MKTPGGFESFEEFLVAFSGEAEVQEARLVVVWECTGILAALALRRCSGTECVVS